MELRVIQTCCNLLKAQRLFVTSASAVVRAIKTELTVNMKMNNHQTKFGFC